MPHLQPGVNSSLSLEVLAQELSSLAGKLVADVAADCTRLEQSQVAILHDWDLAEGLLHGEIWGLVLSSHQAVQGKGTSQPMKTQ